MLPDGGALTPALKRLGYTPYSLRSSFQQGHASTHTVEWAQLLEGKKKFDKTFFSNYDCFVGPPSAILYDAILKECSPYTKVILVEETEKETWANNYDTYLERLLVSTKRTQKNKISQSFNSMLRHMVVSGNTSTLRDTTPQRTSSPSEMKRSFEKQSSKEAEETTSTDLKNPRAVALSSFEESVKITVPASRLLVYTYGEGWEPICDFLEKAVPSDPFPPYDDGLHVLGNLQERIERAVVMYRAFLAVLLVFILFKTWPYLSGIQLFASEFIQDFKIAMGMNDDDAVQGKQVAKGDAFDQKWTKLGGTVTRTTNSA
ncbi:hypothetical protein AGDE_00754 [Angomonas deanei]|nr:hypothetical protein AGDE_00754 [Angomonas deanei]|eukprot:EPY43168.1 hypothetical protein AGDE_00754 [Angomonas deanei]